MKNTFEKPKAPEEIAEIQKKRTRQDNEFLNEGADYIADGEENVYLKTTKNQIQEKKAEMELHMKLYQKDELKPGLKEAMEKLIEPLQKFNSDYAEYRSRELIKAFEDVYKAVTDLTGDKDKEAMLYLLASYNPLKDEVRKAVIGSLNHGSVEDAKFFCFNLMYGEGREDVIQNGELKNTVRKKMGDLIGKGKVEDAREAFSFYGGKIENDEELMESMKHYKDEYGRDLAQFFERNDKLKSYAVREKINEVEISVAWDSYSKIYTLYLPQIKDISRQVIQISEFPEDAEKTFRHAANIAKQNNDPIFVQRAVKLFIQKEIADY